MAAGGDPCLSVGKAELAADARLLVLGSEKNAAQQQKWCQQRLPAGQPVHSRQALINAVLRQAFDAKAHVVMSV